MPSQIPTKAAPTEVWLYGDAFCLLGRNWNRRNIANGWAAFCAGGLLTNSGRLEADAISNRFSTPAGYAVALCGGGLAEETSRLFYVLCEPTAYFAIAIDGETGHTSICGDWDRMEADFTRIQSRTQELIVQGKPTEAIGVAIVEGCACAAQQRGQGYHP